MVCVFLIVDNLLYDTAADDDDGDGDNDDHDNNNDDDDDDDGEGSDGSDGSEVKVGVVPPYLKSQDSLVIIISTLWKHEKVRSSTRDGLSR